MGEKHYQNDYKKLLGVDESRTASQKLLDRKLVNKGISGARLLEKQQQQELSRKIIKKQQLNLNITESEILEKISKSIFCKDVTKMLKGLNFLLKCLECGQFCNKNGSIGTPEIIQMTMKSINEIRGTMIEQFKMAEIIVKILTKILEIFKNEQQKSGENQIKKEEIDEKDKKKDRDEKEDYEQDEVDKNERLQDRSDQYNKGLSIQKKVLVIKQIQLKILLLELFTDDNFKFQKHLAEIFERIITEMHNFEYQSDPINIPQIICYIDQQILIKLFALPHLSLLEWVQTSIIGFYRNIIKQYRDKLTSFKSYREIMHKYNKMLEKSNQNKQSTNSNKQGNSFNIKKSSTSGGTYTAIQKVDSEINWLKKQ